MEPDATDILKIPLAFEEHLDYLVWGHEASGEFFGAQYVQTITRQYLGS